MLKELNIFNLNILNQIYFFYIVLSCENDMSIQTKNYKNNALLGRVLSLIQIGKLKTAVLNIYTTRKPKYAPDMVRYE